MDGHIKGNLPVVYSLWSGTIKANILSAMGTIRFTGIGGMIRDYQGFYWLSLR